MMKPEKRNLLLQYGIGAASALLVALLVVLSRDLAGSRELLWRAISDGCFVSGVLFSAVGGLSMIASTGVLDIFSYGVRSLPYLFSPMKRKTKGGYYEYKLEREEKRGRAKSTAYILWIGLIMLALAALAALAWYRG